MALLPTKFTAPEEIDYSIDSLRQPTKTYRIDFENKRVIRMVDGKDAMPQAIFKILQTELNDHPEIYGSYGSELKCLIGQQPIIAFVQLQPRITKALMADDRITGAKDFDINIDKKKCSVSFTAETIYGDVEISNFEVYY